MESTQQKIYIVFKNTKILISSEECKKLNTIYQAIEDMETDEIEFPMTEYKSEIFEIMITLIKYIINQKDKTLMQQELVEKISAYSDEIVFNLIMMVNYLDQNEILQAGCQYISNEIKKCKNPEDVKVRFNISTSELMSEEK